MAIESPGLRVGFVTAAADLSAGQFYCVLTTGAFTVNLQTSANGRVDGILQNKPKLGAAAELVVFGTSKAVAGAAIAAGAALGVDASGRVITWVSGTVIGHSWEAAGAAGDIISVHLST